MVRKTRSWFLDFRILLFHYFFPCIIIAYMKKPTKNILKKKKSDVVLKREAKEEIFCQAFATCFNGTKSAIRAKYSKRTATSIASKLLTKPHIIERIEILNKRTIDKLELTRDKVTREIAKIGFSNIKDFVDDDGNVKPIGDLADDHAAVISSIDVDSIFDKRGIARGTVKKMKLYDKMKALTTLDNMFKEDEGGNGDGERPDDKFL